MCVAMVLLPSSIMAQAAGDVQSPQTPDRFHLGGFGDLDLRHSFTSGQDAFDSAELDLYFTAQLSDNWSALGEVLAQRTRNDADVEARITKPTELDIERLYLAYSSSDLLRIEAGQVHTGLVRWNEREHRGRFLQTSIDVPAIARREEQGGAWPLHFVGFWGSGLLPGPLGLTYGLGVGEGRGKVRDEIQPLADPESTPAAVVSLGVAPDAVPGLELGVSAYRGRIPSPEGHLRELDRTVSASYVSGSLEFRSEWSRMNHTLISDGHKFTTSGSYALLSYRLKGNLQKLRPYLLLDHLSLPETERYLDKVRETKAWAAGVRWDLSSRVALKFDFRSQTIADRPDENLLRLQAAFNF